VLSAVPVLPLDRRLVLPVVHADDVADAFARVLASRTPGAFNLAAEPPLTVEDIAGALSARAVHVPAAVVRAAVAGSWHARLQPLDPGWIDLAYQVPMLDTDRARRVLGWTPAVDARSVIEETVAGMRAAAHDATATLRPRTVGRQLADFARSGSVTRRRRP
jgi:nucleoside-diphosphate-sugar epimerase